MRGDTVHSGAAYANGHFGRIHCYLDHPLCKRGYNSTERVDVTTDRCVQNDSINPQSVMNATNDVGKNRKRKRVAKK